MKSYLVPQNINYIAAFLTFGCQLKCSYCINRAGELRVSRGAPLTPKQWIKGLSKFVTRSDLPITLQGGEPTTYKGFYELVQGLPDRLPLDLLTNAQFDIDKFTANINPSKFGRVAPYAPIRVSFHCETMEPIDTLIRLINLSEKGYKVGVFAVDVPENRVKNEAFAQLCIAGGIDFRWKEYLAPGHGTYRYPQYASKPKENNVMCRTSEILMDPCGNFFRCHSDLYSNINTIGNLMDSQFPMFDKERFCAAGTTCSGCDIKLKTDRFQKFGHSSVTINERLGGN